MKTESGTLIDQDTLLHGTEAPYRDWEGTYTALVSVLWDAKHDGLRLDDAEDTDRLASMINRSRWMAAARAEGPRPRGGDYGQPEDRDTKDKGVEGPFEDYESDHTALVHVLWAAKRHGFTIAADNDKIATMIVRSRWMAAARAAGPRPR